MRGYQRYQIFNVSSSSVRKFHASAKEATQKHVFLRPNEDDTNRNWNGTVRAFPIQFIGSRQVPMLHQFPSWSQHVIQRPNENDTNRNRRPI